MIPAIANMITEDPDIFVDVLAENVEKLIPHLKTEVYNYISEWGRRRETDDIFDKFGIGPPPKGRNKLDAYVNNIIELALRADPKYSKEHARGKPLKSIKAPFVKSILKWWLSPDSTDTITFPEDIETVAETLNGFNIAKQHGLNANITDFNSLNSLRRTVSQYTNQGGEIDSDEYSRMGLELAFRDGPWKLYHIPQWIPGEKSTLNDQVCHAAMIGTKWCVKYQQHWNNSKRILYLLLKNGKKFALLDFGQNREFKDPDNAPIGSSVSSADDGLDFLKRFLQDKPARELLFSKSNLGDFAVYSNFLMPLLSETLKQDPTVAINRIQNGEIDDNTSVILKPYVTELLQNDEYVDSLCKSMLAQEVDTLNRGTMILKLVQFYEDEIQPLFHEWLKTNQERIKLAFDNKNIGILNSNTTAKLHTELIPYFAQYLKYHQDYAESLLKEGYNSLKSLVSTETIHNILKQYLIHLLDTDPEFVDNIWQQYSYGNGLRHLQPFGNTLTRYFNRLNSEESTSYGGGTRLVYRKDYNNDPAAFLLDEEPIITSLSMREFGSEYLAELEENGEEPFSEEPDDDLAYVIAKEQHRGNEIISYNPILTFMWNSDHEKLWINGTHEGNIDRFGPLMKNFFQSMVNDPRTKLPNAILEKINEYI